MTKLKVFDLGDSHYWIGASAEAVAAAYQEETGEELSSPLVELTDEQMELLEVGEEDSNEFKTFREAADNLEPWIQPPCLFALKEF